METARTGRKCYDSQSKTIHIEVTDGWTVFNHPCEKMVDGAQFFRNIVDERSRKYASVVVSNLKTVIIANGMGGERSRR